MRMSELERIAYIDDHIRLDGHVLLKDVQNHFEVSERQLRRDIRLMRELKAPIEYDSRNKFYIYSTPNYEGLKFTSEKALLFYVFAQAAAGTLAYIPLRTEDPLKELLARIPKEYQPITASIRYDLPEFEKVTSKLEDNLSTVIKSIRERKRISVQYCDAQGIKANHMLEPLSLVNYSGTWYCAAFDVANSQIRIYKLSRFDSIAQTKDPYTSSYSPEDIDKFLNSSYGMFKGQGDKTAVIRFYGRARDIVQNEVWMRYQQPRDGEDPKRGRYLELSLPVSHYEEILGRVLRFGADAEAIGPEDFRAAWKDAIRKMAALISD